MSLNFGKLVKQMFEAKAAQESASLHLFRKIATPETNAMIEFDALVNQFLPTVSHEDRQSFKSFCEAIALHFQNRSHEATQVIRNLIKATHPSWLAQFAQISLMAILWSQKSYKHFIDAFKGTVLSANLENEIAEFIREQLTDDGKIRPKEETLLQNVFGAYEKLCGYEGEDLNKIPENATDILEINYNNKLHAFNNALVKDFITHPANDPIAMRILALFVKVNENDHLSYSVLAKHIIKNKKEQISALVNLVKYKGGGDSYKIFISSMPNILMGAVGRHDSRFKNFSQLFSLIEPLNLNLERAYIENYLEAASNWEIDLEPATHQKLLARSKSLPSSCITADKNFEATCRRLIDTSRQEMNPNYEAVMSLRKESQIIQAAKPEWLENFLKKRLEELNLTILAQINHLYLDLMLVEGISFDDAKDAHYNMLASIALRGHILLLLGNHEEAEKDLSLFELHDEMGDLDDVNPVIAALGYIEAINGNFDQAYERFESVFNSDSPDDASLEYFKLASDLNPASKDESSPWHALYTQVTKPKNQVYNRI